MFARAEYAEPLELQGTLRAAGDAAAAEQARRRFGGDWVELVLLPERAIHVVVGERLVALGHLHRAHAQWIAVEALRQAGRVADLAEADEQGPRRRRPQ